MQLGRKTHRLPHIVSLCLFVTLAALVFRVLQSVSPKTEMSRNASGVREIALGTTIHDRLVAGTKATFSVSATAGSLLRFSIEKRDLVLSTILYGPTGTKLLEHISHEFEVVDLSFPVETAGTYQIELLSHEKTERPFELNLRPLTPLTLTSQKDSEARQALARAELLRSESTEIAFRRAIEQFDQATQIWSSLSDFENASYASLKSGDLLFDLSEYSESLQRYQNAKTFAGKTGNWLAKAKALSRMSRVETYTGQNSLAQEHVEEATGLFGQRQGDLSVNAANAYGEALSVKAEIVYSNGALIKASKQFKEALVFFRDNRKGEAKAHLLLGYINGTLGYLEQAANDSSIALNLYRTIGDKRGEGLALISMGLSNSFRAQSEAIDSHRRARDVFRSLGDKTSEAIALNALGQASENLHDDSALTYYEQALALFEEKGIKDAQTNSLLKIAQLYFDKDLDKALAYGERCLKLSQQMGNARTEALVRSEIARVYTAQKRYALSSTEYDKVRRFYESTKDLRGQAMALNDYGDFLLQVGQKEEALRSFDNARSLGEKVGDKEVLIAALYNLARAHFQLGSNQRALTLIKESLREIEDQRSSIESPGFRASYFSGVQRNLKLCIEILMQLERQYSGEGHLAEAFQVSEKSHARLLRELVIESSERQGGASTELLQRDRELRARFRAQAQYRMSLSMEDPNSVEVSELDRDLAQITVDFQEVQTKLRQQDFGLLSAESLTVDQIQRELRDDNTIVLEFSLGDERSYLFAITNNSIQAYELPGSKVVERAVREFMELITARERGKIDNNYAGTLEAQERVLVEKGRYLSRMLFGALRDKLEKRRLVIVPEGALHGLAFDALPAPVDLTAGPTASRKLIETNEIVIEPSISTLAAIRKPRNRRASPRKVVAIFVDPVLDRSDERVLKSPLSYGTALAAANNDADRPIERSSETLLRDGTLTRLVHASEEADAIAAAAPWGSTMVAKGFDASRETAMSQNVGQYQIVHFATHGFFNSEHPELSGIVLSMVNRNGTKTNGLMPLPDIYNLDYSAELTVLSACQTALGKDVKGEGVVGLTHSFLSAGSKSVVATLWKVDDRATAVFMAKFYERMLQNGESPAAALREAKLMMMHDKQWSAPYYWAGFVLQGEYENHIDVDRSFSLGLVIALLVLLSLSAVGLLLSRSRKRQFPPIQSS